MDNSKTLARIGSGLFGLAAFALYLHTVGPTVVPYRDAGEMATAVPTLGILHPPSYPTYTVLAHLFSRLPLANPAYRLNVFSALALAIAWTILFCLLADLFGAGVALPTLVLGCVSYQFWAHALVSEMYTLNLTFLALILWCVQRQRWRWAAFVLGLGLGNRPDLVLCAPAFLFLAFPAIRGPELRKDLWKMSLAFLLGFSIYLYLPLRAMQHPFLNWNDPSSLDRFLGNMLRRGYGGTLDLLSKSYGVGENFGSEFGLYLRHLWQHFTPLGLPLALIGLAALWKESRRWFWVVLSGWALTGPLFIFLGNLPPNPHAVAIMEAAYLIPDLFFLISVAAGVAVFRNPRPLGLAFGGILILISLALAAQTYVQVNKRQNYIAADFIRNVNHTAPEPSLVVARSDVPIFSLFYGFWVHPRNRWCVPLAQGLAGSAWYQVMMDMQVPHLDVEPAKTAADWEALAKTNPGWPLFGTPDTDWPAELFPRLLPYGVLLQLAPKSKGAISLVSSDTYLQDLGVYRGRYRYDAYAEFFSPELIEEYAKAWMEWGKLLTNNHQTPQVIEAFRHALSLKPDMPYPVFQLGYLYFSNNQFPQADFYYHWAVDNFRIMEREAVAWKSSPTILKSVRQDEAQAMAQWGVVQERLGRTERAVNLYEMALGVDPNCADAQYNMAVVYWRQGRWSLVVDYLQALARAHPDDPRWKAYLPAALQHLNKRS
jgi:hypothetical protein